MKHKWHKEIKAWADGALIEKRKESSEWLIAVCPRWDIHEDIEYRIKPHAKCITKDCTNHVNEGKFIGDLCAPCWEYITNGNGVHSQAYRNAQPKEPQYLYVWKNKKGIDLTDKYHGYTMDEYIGKIKLEVDDD